MYTTRRDTTRPCDGCTGPDPTTICAVSIVRSGDALLEVVRDVEPSVRVGKILIQRDESHPDKIAKLFYSKLPPTIGTPSTPYVLLCDPMLATGGSAVTAIEVLIGDQYKVDPAKIIFANMICAPEGLKLMAKKYPQIKIVTVAIDECLNDEKFIVPGLGEFREVQCNAVQWLWRLR
jgi:uracil phosphoribosyltransferase